MIAARTLLTAFAVVTAVSALGPPSARGYNDEVTHPLINERVYEVSGLDEYFSEQLGAPVDGLGRLSVRYRGSLPAELFQEGGREEDNPLTRAWNHFHDPLNDWEHAGYTKPFFPDGISSLLWAQYGLVQHPPWISGPNHEWNWQQAYAYFETGLSAPDPAVRELNLANLFTALGHVTHLLADASVPEHARNDTHILRSYETWCQENLVTVDDAVYGVPVFRDAFGPQPAIFEQDRGEAFGSGPLSRVSNLWDSQAAPGVNRHLGVSPRLVGLADYSNHDYFSGDTVFATYPHPAAGEATLNLYAVPLPEGGTEERLFFSRTTSDGVFVRFLAAAGLLVQDLQDVEPGSEFDNAHLDDSCYEDYASNLIPRAVSYGADLVDYFLRARLAATAEGTTLRIENLSAGRVSGAVTVYADASDGTRSPVPGFTNIALDLAAGAFVAWAGFAPPVTPDLRYLLLFTGQTETGGAAGQWEAAAAGRVFTWNPLVLPRSTRGHSSRLVVRGYIVPHIRNERLSTPLSEGQSIGCSCHFVHGSTYPIQLGDDMTNLELCQNCHGPRAVGNRVPSWAPPRILVSPDAVPPEIVPAADVDTFNPHDGDTVSGLVQFLPAVFDATHRTESPVKYRLEVWESGAAEPVSSHPAGAFGDVVGGWAWATGLWFLRDWDYPERLVWDSRAVGNGTYRFEFYPMSNPDLLLPPRVGTPAVLTLTVSNAPGM